MTTAKKGKAAASVSYLTLVGCLIAITMNMESKNTFARFHIRQAFGIHLLYHGLAIVLTFTGIIQASFWLSVFYLLIIIYGLFSALSQKKASISLVGPLFQKWFTFIQ